MSYHSSILLILLFVPSQQFQLLPFCKPTLQMRNDKKVLKHLFRPAFSSISVAVLVITVFFSMIKSVKSINRAFLKVFVLMTMI
jgi:hypothetical protein